MHDPEQPASGVASIAAYIGLGSNLGDREAQLAFARCTLDESAEIEVEASSRIYETDPVGPPPQGPYLNAVLRVRTRLAPGALLERLLAIERAAGRDREDRSRPRWSARCLDLDLLLYGERCIDEPGLVVPHPRLAERAFVLEPLSELAAAHLHPLLHEPFGQLAARVRDPKAVRLWRSGRGSWAPC